MDVDHLEKLADAATPGPWAWWAVTETTDSGFGPYGRVVGPTYVSIDHAEALSPADAEFIGSVHPETVKELCAELRRLKAELSFLNLYRPLPRSPLEQRLEEEVDQSIGNLQRVAREYVCGT